MLCDCLQYQYVFVYFCRQAGKVLRNIDDLIARKHASVRILTKVVVVLGEHVALHAVQSSKHIGQDTLNFFSDHSIALTFVPQS